MKNKPEDVVDIDGYIAAQSEQFRATLSELRAIVHEVVPGVQESISYMVPCFKHIYMLVGIGVSKKYCSFYIMSSSLPKKMKPELEGIRSSSGTTLHFIPNEKLPIALLKKIIAARVNENELRAAKKK